MNKNINISRVAQTTWDGVKDREADHIVIDNVWEVLEYLRACGKVYATVAMQALETDYPMLMDLDVDPRNQGGEGTILLVIDPDTSLIVAAYSN